MADVRAAFPPARNAVAGVEGLLVAEEGTLNALRGQIAGSIGNAALDDAAVVQAAATIGQLPFPSNAAAIAAADEAQFLTVNRLSFSSDALRNALEDLLLP